MTTTEFKSSRAGHSKSIHMSGQGMRIIFRDKGGANLVFPAEFTCQQLEEISNDVALLVASDKGRILGYLCACSCDYYKQFPLLPR